MQKKFLISPISIDLGAKNTGVILSHYEEGELLHARHNEAHVITLSNDGDKITFSQVNRTTKRHAQRSKKRRSYAKRILKLAFEQLLKRNLIELTTRELDAAFESINGSFDGS